jgi:hypothetical protein
VQPVVVLREIERLRIPRRILQEDVLEDVVADVERFAAAGDRRPLQFAARLEARENHVAGLGVLRASVQPADRFNLWRCKARVVVRARVALNHLRIEMAARDVLDEAVLQSIEAVARVERRAVNGRVLRGRDHALRRLVRRLPFRHEAESFVAAVVGRRTREDGVEVGGIALRFLKRHPPPARAAGEVRQLRPDAVEVRNRLFAVDGRQVHRAVTPVRNLFRMSGGPLSARARMARVR